jgi:lipopolysaccharide/colanic/teichoic acid biosynthesis glycosyltransferase
MSPAASEPLVARPKGRSAKRALRALDLALIGLSAVVWLPVVGLLSATVVLTSGRPIFFVQERAGQNGRPFPMVKFRSMKNGDNPLIPDPDRITRVGHLLRRTSLDELPQLLNVLRGSMSLVGPRPMLLTQVEALDDCQRRRLEARPGMTGLAQVSGRNELTWDERFTFDIEWVDEASPARYLWILARTARTVTSGSGVSGHRADDRVVAIELAADPKVVDLNATEISVQEDLTQRRSAQRAAS